MLNQRQALLLLTVFTVSRTCVSFQFQSLTPLVEFLAQRLGIGATGFGLLLGLYMAPGAVMAIVLPLLTRKLGDRNTLVLALALMALGHVLLVQAHADIPAYAARLLAGIGGCIVYIATIDFAAKYCRAGEQPGRMGFIATSWPFGNAISLIVIGVLVSAGLTRAAAYVPVALCLIALCLVLVSRPLFVAGGEACAPRRVQPSLRVVLQGWRQALAVCWLPGLTFALYNIGFIIFVSFSTPLLTSQGYSASAASSIASLPMWLFVISVPLGGLLAGRSRATAHALVAFGCVGGALCIGASYLFDSKVLWYVAAGICGGLPTGPMLSKVGRSDHTLFYPAIFLIFFIALLVLPPLAGLAIDVLNDQRSAIVMAMLLVVSGWWLFVPSVRQPRHRAESL
jgi:predicted MFS family arabinose efflux permease